MKYRKIIAVVPELSVAQIERDLIALGVSEMTICKKHGMGEYRNFYTKDQKIDCIEVTVYSKAEQTQTIVNSIMKSAHKGLPSDGIVTVVPVEALYYIKDFTAGSLD